MLNFSNNYLGINFSKSFARLLEINNWLNEIDLRFNNLGK